MYAVKGNGTYLTVTYVSTNGISECPAHPTEGRTKTKSDRGHLETKNFIIFLCITNVTLQMISQKKGYQWYQCYTVGGSSNITRARNRMLEAKRSVK